MILNRFHINNTMRCKETITLQEYIYKAANRLYTNETFTDAVQALATWQRDQIAFTTRTVMVRFEPKKTQPKIVYNPKTVRGHNESIIERLYQNGGTLADIYKLLELNKLYSNFQDFIYHLNKNESLSRRIAIIDRQRNKNKKYAKTRSILVKFKNEFMKNAKNNS